MVLAHHRRQPPFEPAEQIAEAADMWSTTYQPLCCGRTYVVFGAVPLVGWAALGELDAT
jgi:hypothetical protein